MSFIPGGDDNTRLIATMNYAYAVRVPAVTISMTLICLCSVCEHGQLPTSNCCSSWSENVGWDQYQRLQLMGRSDLAHICPTSKSSVGTSITHNTLSHSRKCSGQFRLYNEFLRQRKPDVTHYPREFWFGSDASMGSIIRDPLYDFLYMRVSKLGFSRCALSDFFSLR